MFGVLRAAIRIKFEFGALLITAILIGFLSMITVNARAQKNDTVYLNNGDRLTGEFKKFEYGQLFLKTDAMQTVYIEFDKISTIYSAKFFEIRTKSGYRYFGSLRKSEKKGTVLVVTSSDTIPKPLWDIVEVTTIRNKFFQRIDGSISLGLSFTKASDVFQYNLAAEVVHRSRHYSTRFDLNSILTDQKDKDMSNNTNIGLNVTRYLPSKWFVRVQASGQQNTELDLKLRLQCGMGGGYDIVRSNSIRFYGLLGLIYNNEQTIDSAIMSNNMEILASTQFKWFQYRHPKIDVTTGLNFYYNLIIKNRIRLEFDLKTKFEIVKDLFFEITLYDSYDNKPFTGESAKNDWGIITSIGYTF
jgi:sRNA-binding regulator protein Hfq